MIAQIFFNAVISALMLSLVAIGFNLIFNATKVFHLAHGAVYASAVYAAIPIYNYFYPSLGNFTATTLAVIFSLFIVSTLIVLIEWLAYRPLYKSGGSPAISLITSLGVSIFITNFLTFLFGSEAVRIGNHTQKSVFQNEMFNVTDVQFLQMLVSVGLMISVYLFSKSKYNIYIRAIGDNYQVSEKFGVNVQKTRFTALIIGSLLAGVAGLLKGIDVSIDAHTGMAVTLTASVAVIVGGARSLLGTFAACFAIALIQNFSDLWLSAQWKEGITYTILLLVLVFFTEGLFTPQSRLEER